MELFGETLPTTTALFLILALLMALSFEFVNGFHEGPKRKAKRVLNSVFRLSIVVWDGVLPFASSTMSVMLNGSIGVPRKAGCFFERRNQYFAFQKSPSTR